MNQDEEHLRLLSIFYYVCAGLAALVACIPMIHLVVGLFLLFNPRMFGPENNQAHPERFVGLLFVLMSIVFISIGWAFAACIAFAGRCLGQHRNYTFCIVMAGVACMFMPIGTILGIFSIIVLIRPSVKALFNGTTPPVFAK